MKKMKELLGPKTEKQAKLAIQAMSFVARGIPPSAQETLTAIREAGYKNKKWGKRKLHEFVQEEWGRVRYRYPTLGTEMLQRSSRNATLRQ